MPIYLIGGAVVKFRKEKVIAVYKTKGCNVSATCKAVGVSRAHFYRIKKSSKKFARALKDAEESNIDNVETALLSAVGEGNITAIIFFLKTKGRKRGYVEKIEHDTTITSIDPVQILLPDNGR